MEKCGTVTSALELGCNVGRNLNCLRQELGINVAGIEISEKALSLMKDSYPALQDCKTYVGDMNNVITEIAENSYDLVYSMAVLMHLHPATPVSFWSQVVRVASKYIITIENESGSSNRNWIRNYKEIFEGCGARQIYEENNSVISDAYVMRIFRCDHNGFI